MPFSTPHTTHEISQSENGSITSLMMLLTSSTAKETYKRKRRILNNEWTYSSVYEVRALLRTCTRNLIYPGQISGKSEDTKPAFICMYMYFTSLSPVKLTFLEKQWKIRDGLILASLLSQESFQILTWKHSEVTCMALVYTYIPLSPQALMSAHHSGLRDITSSQLNGTDISRAPTCTKYQFRAEGKTVLTISA